MFNRDSNSSIPHTNSPTRLVCCQARPVQLAGGLGAAPVRRRTKTRGLRSRYLSSNKPTKASPKTRTLKAANNKKPRSRNRHRRRFPIMNRQSYLTGSKSLMFSTTPQPVPHSRRCTETQVARRPSIWDITQARQHFM